MSCTRFEGFTQILKLSFGFAVRDCSHSLYIYFFHSQKDSESLELLMISVACVGNVSDVTCKGRLTPSGEYIEQIDIRSVRCSHGVRKKCKNLPFLLFPLMIQNFYFMTENDKEFCFNINTKSGRTHN